MHWTIFTAKQSVLNIKRPPATIRAWCMHAFVLVVYVLLGALGYTMLEQDWSWNTAMYFSFSLVSTVGYGCIAPSSTNSRVFTLLYALCSIPLITASLSAVTVPIMRIPYKKFASIVVRRAPFFRTDYDDPLHPPSPMYYYVRGMLPPLLFSHTIAVGVISWFAWAASRQPDAFRNSLAGTESHSLNFGEAVYFTIITSTTIGAQQPPFFKNLRNLLLRLAHPTDPEILEKHHYYNMKSSNSLCTQGPLRHLRPKHDQGSA